MFYRKIPFWAGNLIEILGLGIGFLLLLFLQKIPSQLQIVALLIVWFCFWYFSHCLAHYVAGKAFGLKFSHYFLGKSAITKINSPIFSIFRYFPVFGIKVDADSLRKLTKKKRFAFFASGTIASMFLPAVTLIPAIQMGKFFYFFMIITIGNILFTLLFSPKVGDLSKATLKDRT